MAYRNSTYNLLALILVLMISLITKPVLGMSVHKMNMVTTPSTTSQMPLMSHQHPVTASEEVASNNCHQPAHLLSEAPSECCANTDSVTSSCSDCDLTHCQPYSSYLPIGNEAFSDFPHDRLIPQLTPVHPVSRTETLFRPPIL